MDYKHVQVKIAK